MKIFSNFSHSHRDWCEESVGGFKRMGLLFAVDVWMRKKAVFFSRKHLELEVASGE